MNAHVAFPDQRPIIGRKRVVLPTFHKDQATAFWKMQPSRFKALRAGRRWGKTDYGKTWILDGLARGYPCAWYAPQHKTWSEAYSEMVDHIKVLLEPGSSKGGAVMRSSTGGRLDFWTLENPISGRGRHYRRVVIDEAAFAKDGDNTDDASLMGIYEKVIKPTLFDYGGDILVCSNSHGKNPNNFFYNICTDPKYGFIEYHAPTHRNDRLPKRMPGETPIEWLARRQKLLDDLKTDNDPLVYAQEYLAEFVDWAGAAFFMPDKWYVGTGEDAKLVPQPNTCMAVFATIDTAVKTGYENDGTAVIYWAVDKHRKRENGWLVMLDWDIQKIEGGSLNVWLPGVHIMLEHYAKTCLATRGSLGAFIEDKGSGTVLLQQAAKIPGMRSYPMPEGLTAMGKDERALNASPYHYQGLIKMSDVAKNKVVTYNRHTRNHLYEQVTSFRMADEDANKREDDLLDCYTYGIAIGLGNAEGF